MTGGEKVFAAGADIKEMAERGPFDELIQERLAYRDQINRIGKPMIAAVSGFALGGGCELAISCDVIIASESARFGQPEVNLGIIPGSGGTQRLTHLLGKHRAMELVLTGEAISATEAERLGLINRVVPVELFLEEAKNVARKIAAKPVLAIKAAKEAVLKAANTPLDEGLDYERKSFLFAVRFRGPPRRYASFSRKAQAGVPRQVTKRSTLTCKTILCRNKTAVGDGGAQWPQALNAFVPQMNEEKLSRR